MWSTQVVAHLAESKRQGIEFAFAWKLATNRFPPAGGWSEPDTLFNEKGEVEEPFDVFLRRVCEAAYNDVGRVPGYPMEPPISQFRPDMLRDLDSSAPALRAWGSQGRRRQAA